MNVKMDLSDYQKEQLETLLLVEDYLGRLTSATKAHLNDAIQDYMHFRHKIDDFLNKYIKDICTTSCYQNNLSACCGKDSIITFFAEVVINACVAEPDEIGAMRRRLEVDNRGHRCVYLGPHGCLWRVRPIVCAMFLCDAAQRQIENQASAKIAWEGFKEHKKRYTWPDRPVLFDRVEKHFINAGCRSPLMYMHNSPGLLRIKQRWCKD